MLPPDIGEKTMTRIALALAAALFATAALAQPQKTVTVKIDSGPVVGEAGEKANVFRAIPFAAAPTGALRWAPPQAVKPWTTPHPALENGPSCPQPMNADGSPNGGGANGPTSEDCLQLNVWAPPHAKAAPVMVWIHGGGHVVGAGWIYGGENFARDGVVVVTINYRLGALGYFATPQIAAAAKPGEPVGNYGLMDQIAALKWVQRNIAKFGGDPKNVTVFGESAGGMSTLAVLATPSAKGLYAKAIVESGAGWFAPKTLADKEKEGAAALTKAGITATQVADLRALPADKLARLPGDYQPFTDGRLMTETASQALADGRFADVPLIIGSNSGEDSLMGPSPLPAGRMAAIPAAARAVYKDEAAAGDETLARAIFTDRIMGGPARWVAARASTGAPSYLYYFSYVGSRFPATKTRASHADEIQYVWEYWGRRTPMSMVNAKDQEVASLMHACWVAFAKTSVPKCGGTTWPAYAPASDQLMEFGKESGVRAHLRKAQLDAQETATLPTLALGGTGGVTTAREH
jgi:para-nitrobenzyl esterase